ncbi:PAS domain-containing protein [Nocardioides sp. GY 10113]|uniref:PAS domain-containing protein n=1 Tax=Nocardioides sp. GY 10113 TaxID=2569761 RepID=UPI001981DDD0|nr:PAS domain-containing protein [Nocardioides sp. GY 10113]
MSRPAVRPTGVERTFGADEVIVTKTDRGGRMTYVNDVFCRVSAHPEREMLGQPHNMIRHPDMPRAVFKLLWETIDAGREIFALVLNLAGDGAHYWVLAHVTPTRDASGAVVGYHSNRRVPSRAAVAAADGLYRELRAVEARHQGANEAAEAGYQALMARLQEAGQTYDEFVWSLIETGN